ncbi:MAG: sulfatase-like hydrolase/transferase [Rikenellaceae bacterium]|nr:sulfatase-like hydrolase/transferase [Rikenellaceae bacterium]
MTRWFDDFLTLIYRILLLYAAWMLCRIGFYGYNAELLGSLSGAEIPFLLAGSLLFDSVSIFYLNIPFIVLSLLPLRAREHKSYQQMLLWLFVLVNSLGLMVNLADIFYYEMKLGRIASDDLHFLSNGNFGLLLGSFLHDYWFGFLAWTAVGALLWLGFKRIGYRPTRIQNTLSYHASQSGLLAVSVLFAVFMIRGATFSAAVYPINISDAGLFASPSQSALVLSNPFCILRTVSDRFDNPAYFSEEELERIFSPVHTPAPVDTSRFRVEGQPNIMLIILESFGSAHIKELSDQFAPDEPSYTPFLDSLIRQGYIFRNAYHNGSRSLDALPALWASIPTFKRQFLSMPQSMSQFDALPELLREQGYSTAFLHGAVRKSMSFVAFGNTVGMEHFWSQEEYEEEHSKEDFDGKWGIWDHKFFPYAAEKIGALPEPFFATLFSLSSHHPYRLPPGFEGRYPLGNTPNHKMYGYSDQALGQMFEQMSAQPWFENTIFVLTADHGYTADNEKYLKVPYNFAVPLLFYSPSGIIPAGSDYRPAGHIDVMPTLLGMTGYNKSYFAFGQDLLADTLPGKTINYMGAFNIITDQLLYIFNEHDFVEIYHYRDDPLQQVNLAPLFSVDDEHMQWGKAFIQQYYRHVNNRKYTVP